MNYKPSRDGDQEFLLSIGSHWAENTSSLQSRTDRPSHVTTSATSDPASTEKPHGDKEGNSVDLRNGNSVHRSDDVQTLSGDTLHDGISLSSTVVNKQVKTTLDASSPDWVSFEESSNHANSQDPTTDHIVIPSRGELPSRQEDDRFPGETTTDWVKFGAVKDNNEGTLVRPFTQPGDDPVDKSSARQSTKEELLCLMLEDSLLGNDVYEKPFDNRELDRINPFSLISSQRDSNCIPNATHHSLCHPFINESNVIPNAIHHSQCHPHDPASDMSQVETSSYKSTRNENGTSSENLVPLAEYPQKPTNNTWSVLLRYPDIKRKLRARVWRPVVIKLDGSVLQVFEEHDKSSPFREVSLQCFYALTTPKLQQYHGGKVHTVKLLYVKYKEKFAKKNVQYVARTTPILKIASNSHLVMHEFTEVVKDAIRSLPIFRDRGISHNTEAVYIDVQDTCSALLDSTGAIIMLGILVRIYLRAFISGDAECQLVLNDHHLKSQEITRLREEHMPQHIHKWINLENCNFHSTVNPATYDQNRYILFKPLDSCTFEVMQFRVRPLKPLPLLARCDIIVDGHGRIELKAEIRLCSDPKLAKYERNNVCLYFPIPETWISLFRKEKLFRGEKSIRSTSAQKAIKIRNRFNRPACTIEVSTGSAKYEPEYKAIVWRIDQLPLLNTTAPADAPHDFTCHIQTRDLPENFKPHCTMEYEIPYTVASDTNIVNFKVSDQKLDTQEITYCAYYSYHIQMNATSWNGEARNDSWNHH